VALAIVAALSALSIWAVVERGHAQNRAHALRVFNTSLQTQNASLTHEAQTLSTRLRNKREAARRTLVLLQVANRGLRGGVKVLLARRDVLNHAIASLEAQNGQLTAEVAHLNAQNKALAAEVNRLDAEAGQLETQLFVLQQEQETLSGDAQVLK